MRTSVVSNGVEQESGHLLVEGGESSEKVDGKCGQIVDG